MARRKGRSKLPTEPEGSKPYKYTPLRPDQIRVLRLQPGTFEADIELDFSTIDLRSNANVKYEALSYTWGSTENKKRIHVGSRSNGIPSTIDITSNLDQALRHLRSQDHARTFWIDAICINQDDLTERSQQVGIMGDIYRKSDFMTIWLGPGNQQSDAAMEMFRLWAMVAHFNLESNELVVPPEALPGHAWMIDGNPRLISTPEQTLMLEDLMFRSWFERLWIQQEIYLTRKRAVVLCGRESMSWSDFCVGLSLVCIQIEFRSSSFSTQEFYTRILILSDLVSPDPPTSGLEMLDVKRDLRCVDPRDKIYGMLSMLDHDNQEHWLVQACRPDYSLHVRRLYEKVVDAAVENWRTLEFLPYCHPVPVGLALPSWVPDWSQRRRILFRNQSLFADSHCQVSAQLSKLNSATIRVSGKVVGRIDDIAPTGLSCDSSAICPRRLFVWLIGDTEPSKCFRIAQAFVHAMFHNNLADKLRWDVPEHRTKFPSTAAVIEWLVAEREDGSLADMVHGYCSMTMAGRQLAKDVKNRLALVPDTAMDGDCLVVLLGSGHVMCLRATSRGRYSIVGPCFYPGFNEGEALLGDLPDDWSCVKFRDRDNKKYKCYEHTPSGSLTTLDPRIHWGELRSSDGWSVPSLSTKYYWEKGKGTPGLPWSYQIDKGRLGPLRHVDEEYLVRHGVRLESFTLV